MELALELVFIVALAVVAASVAGAAWARVPERALLAAAVAFAAAAVAAAAALGIDLVESFADTETETPLVDVDNDGWRLGVGLTYTPLPAWRFDGGYREEFGPGASSDGFEGSVTWLPTRALSLSAYGSTLDRPLEFRFENATILFDHAHVQIKSAL